jgi:ATP-dependent DNA helicase PIF1
MIRQRPLADPELTLGRTVDVPPVVMPTTRTAVAEPEPDATVVTFAPVVRKRRGSAAPAVTAAAMDPVAAAEAEPPLPFVEPEPDTRTAEEIRAALNVPFSGLFGAAGSGKTFLTKAWAEEESGLVLAATTGIAAINLGGETINSILGYFDTASLQEKYINGSLTATLGKLWRAGVRRLVVDEVSMLAGDQLTYLAKAIEEVNGRGYVLGKWSDDDDAPPPAMGLTLVGDFLQLAPVKATYAFESPEWARFTNTVTLTAIRRQADPEFIAMLRAARRGNGAAVADYFGTRSAIHDETDDRFNGPTLVAKNESVDRYNGLRMAQLPGHDVAFPSSRWGKLRSEWGTLEKPPQTWGIPQVLGLKIGALVMVLANYRDPELKSLVYVNGDLGTLIDAEDGFAYVRLQRTAETVRVQPVTRQVKVPCDSARRAELRKDGHGDRIDGRWEIVGAITYMPLRVAYASTVHKSQGLSLDRVQINIRDHFFKSPGMLYVALSRARTMAGLRLVGSPGAIVDRCTTDPRLKAWL